MKRYVVTYNGEEDHDLIISLGGIIIDDVPFINTLLVADLSDEMVSLLKKNPIIKSVDLDESVETQAVGYFANSNIKASFNYGVPRLKLKEYWDRGIDGSGVKVLVLDTGCAIHENIDAVERVSFYDANLEPTFDNQGHGTHVAGIVGSKPKGNGGFVGSAYGVDLYIGKGSGSGDSGIYSSAIVRAFNYAIEKQIDIVNCSYSLPGANTAQSTIAAYDAYLNNGGIIVFSSGNSGNTSLSEFAGKDGVITVSSLNYNDKRAGSSYGELLKFSCYGAAIMSCSREDSNGFLSMSGTSMAAPYMTGIVAMYKQLFPTLTRSELIEKLIANATIPNSSLAFDVEYGYGVVMPPSELYDLDIVRQSIPRGLYRTGDIQCNYYSI